MSMMIDNTKARPTIPMRIALLLATAMMNPAMLMDRVRSNALVIVLCLPSSKDDILCCLEYLR